MRVVVTVCSSLQEHLSGSARPGLQGLCLVAGNPALGKVSQLACGVWWPDDRRRGRREHGVCELHRLAEGGEGGACAWVAFHVSREAGQLGLDHELVAGRYRRR